MGLAGGKCEGEGEGGQRILAIHDKGESHEYHIISYRITHSLTH